MQTECEDWTLTDWSIRHTCLRVILLYIQIYWSMNLLTDTHHCHHWFFFAHVKHLPRISSLLDGLRFLWKNFMSLYHMPRKWKFVLTQTFYHKTLVDEFIFLSVQSINENTIAHIIGTHIQNTHSYIYGNVYTSSLIHNYITQCIIYSIIDLIQEWAFEIRFNVWVWERIRDEFIIICFSSSKFISTGKWEKHLRMTFQHNS